LHRRRHRPKPRFAASPNISAIKISAECCGCPRDGPAALAGQLRLLTQSEQLLQVNQRYAVTREEQARDFTLALPVLRTCVRLLGEQLVATSAVEQADDVFFRTRYEVTPVQLAGLSRWSTSWVSAATCGSASAGSPRR
jgi:hypothetical protein